MGRAFPRRKTHSFQAPIKVAQPLLAPELRAGNFTDTRIFFFKGRGEKTEKFLHRKKFFSFFLSVFSVWGGRSGSFLDFCFFFFFFFVLCFFFLVFSWNLFWGFSPALEKAQKNWVRKTPRPTLPPNRKNRKTEKQKKSEQKILWRILVFCFFSPAL